MAENCMFSRGERLEKDQDFDHSMVESQELHVLAVDDCLVDRTVIERLLKISCYKVTSVDSGRRALQFLGLDGEKNSAGIEGLKVNLIITDYCMPGMTGYELLKKIKESSTFKEIPVVIMSSENVVTRINRCLEEGAEGFIVKPVKLSDVKRLKDYITRDERGQEHVERGETTNNINNINNNNNKRKFQNTSDDDMALTTPLPPLNSTTPSSAPLDSTPSSPMNTKPSSPLDSDSPSRRLRPTNDTL